MERGLAANIMLMPGKAFQPEQGKPCQYLRAAFSIAPEQNFDPAMERLADLIRWLISGGKKLSMSYPPHPTKDKVSPCPNILGHGKVLAKYPDIFVCHEKTNMLQKAAPFAPYPGPQALDLVCRDAICVSTFYLALCLAVRFPEAWNRKGTEGSPAIKNIATGEMSQAITPYHFFNYLTSLAFITR